MNSDIPSHPKCLCTGSCALDPCADLQRWWQVRKHLCPSRCYRPRCRHLVQEVICKRLLMVQSFCTSSLWCPLRAYLVDLYPILILYWSWFFERSDSVAGSDSLLFFSINAQNDSGESLHNWEATLFSS